MYYRNITTRILNALKDSPVLFLNGARQTGKSTLVQRLSRENYPARYLTLDDSSVLSAAANDPSGFIAGLEGPVIIDEVQRVPELFLSIKKSVDQNRRPGQFILTGSANVLLLPNLADSLAGRMEILTLWPFSEAELRRSVSSFAGSLFEDTLPTPGEGIERTDLIIKLVTGGYPEVVRRSETARREAWFDSYITTILQRDIRDIANIEGLTLLPRLLSILATRAGHLLNYSELSRTSGIAQSTLKRYMTLLETTFLIRPLPAWSSNLGKKLVKSPKVMVCDSGLSCYLTGTDQQKLEQDPTVLGNVLENFVCMELVKQISWLERKYQLFHYRSMAGKEVDFIIEDRSGRIVAVEVKSRATVKSDDLKNLKQLASETREKFCRGILFYTGTETIPFGGNLFAMPVSSLWSAAPAEQE